MQTPSPNNETHNPNNTITSSERRPSSFLDANLDATEMDPDLMFASAVMGGYAGYFHLPDWNNASTMAVRDYEIATPYDDNDDPGVEAERLLLRRSSAVPERSSVGETVVGETVVAVAACGSEDLDVGISPRKRRLSARVGEVFGGFGKAVKRRAGSWGWRRDSVALLFGGRRDGERDSSSRSSRSSSLIVAPGSGERSRDGDDEGSGGD